MPRISYVTTVAGDTRKPASVFEDAICAYSVYIPYDRTRATKLLIGTYHAVEC